MPCVKEYSLLLTDLNMPGINGFELLELLRSSNVGNSPTIPVVVATASGSCNKGELLAKGFAGCLFKPFSISELMEVSDRCAIKTRVRDNDIQLGDITVRHELSGGRSLVA